MSITTYELKYCERCGSLGLRRSQSAESYCEPCGQVLVSPGALTRAERRLLLRSFRHDRRALLKLDGPADSRLPSGRLQ